jgi:hypothetical protein
MPITVAKRLLYYLKTIHEAIVLRPPKTIEDANNMLAIFEVMAFEGVKEAEEDLAPEPAGAPVPYKPLNAAPLPLPLKNPKI